MKLLNIKFGIIFLSFVFFNACTPKVDVVKKIEEPVKKEVVEEVDENLSPCKKFKDSATPEAAKTAHVLYRDELRMKNYKEAFRLWKMAYTKAPAADGKRDYHYIDGVKFYEHFIKQTKDQNKINIYIDSIFLLYDEAADCYPDKIAIYKGLKAFKLYYSFPEKSTPLKTYNLFKEVIDSEGKKSPNFIINPFTALLVELFLDKKISQEEASSYAIKVMDIVEYGIKNCKKGNDCNRWDIVNSYAPSRLHDLEGVKGFYDCAYYKKRYLAAYQNDSENCEEISTFYSKLKWANCEDVEPLILELKPKMSKCFPVTKKKGINVCSNLLHEGDYNGAINCLEDLVQNTTDNGKKAYYNITISRIYYASLKNFPKARKYAEKAIKNKPTWGAPHILIGKLYASSGTLCGPGTGFDSQRVTWSAMDEWNKAKKDPEYKKEALKLIKQYWQYLPTKEDIFVRSIKKGDTYKVPCWIQRNTIVRTVD